MVFEQNFFEKYKNRLTKILDGVYSTFDCQILYAAVREIKPQKVVEMSPGKGRTTSCIAQALKDNGDSVEYFLFEKQDDLLNNTVSYLKSFPNINIHPESNVINNPNLDLINDIDFLMIDSNHDCLLAKYYIETLFPKVKNGGLIHIHDIYYDRNNNGWKDTGLKFFETIPGQYKHPDIYSEERLLEIYGSEFFSKYYTGKIDRYEEDEIRDFIIRNNIDFYSTKYVIQKLGLLDNGVGKIPSSCSIYFKYNKLYR
jgi:hypothetical protein